MVASMLLNRTITDLDVSIMAAERHSAFGQISSVTKRHTRKERDLSARIRGAKHLGNLSRAKITLRGT
jgi:hypothetical protein